MEVACLICPEGDFLVDKIPGTERYYCLICRREYELVEMTWWFGGPIEPRKFYIGERGPNWTALVFVTDSLSRTLRPLRHVVCHSPTGFEWGDTGKGSADTALSILADHFGERPTKKQLTDGVCACWKLHRHFMQDIIAGLTDGGWRMSRQVIWDWLFRNGSALPVPPAEDSESAD